MSAGGRVNGESRSDQWIDYAPARFFAASSVVEPLIGLSKTAMNYFSPKQSMRPEKFSKTLANVATQVKINLSTRVWQLTNVMKRTFLLEESSNYLSMLNASKKLTSSSDEIIINDEEKALLNQLFDENLNEFDSFIHSHQDDSLNKQHQELKDFFALLDDGFYNRFIEKLSALTCISNIEEIEDLQEHEKLNVADMGVLLSINGAKAWLEKLNAQVIERANLLFNRWVELEKLTQTPFFESLKELCLKTRSTGTIFIGDRHTVRTFNGPDFGCVSAMTELFMGRFCHIAVFVKPEDKGLHLSHVNRITKTHAVTPVRNPLVLPFSYALDLDIRPLIPEGVREDLHERLAEIFIEEFQKLTVVEHRDLPLAETYRHLKMIAFGHQTFSSTPLEEVDYPPSGTPLMCSSYVGIAFLKAIHEVNVALHEFGFDERIAHPFGEHENLMNLDILRLVYLWQQIGIVKPKPMDPTLAKVISSSSIL